MHPALHSSLRVILLSLNLASTLLLAPTSFTFLTPVHAEDTVPVFYLNAWRIPFSPPANIAYYLMEGLRVTSTHRQQACSENSAPENKGTYFPFVSQDLLTYPKPKPCKKPYYQLRYTSYLPRHIPGILSKNFSTTSYDCAGKCAGPALIYDDGMQGLGEWYLNPDRTRQGWWVNVEGRKVWRGVWRLRWVWGELPADAVSGVAVWMKRH